MPVHVTILGEIKTLRHVADSIGRSGWIYRHQIRDGKITHSLADRKLTGFLKPDQIIRLASARLERESR